MDTTIAQDDLQLGLKKPTLFSNRQSNKKTTQTKGFGLVQANNYGQSQRDVCAWKGGLPLVGCMPGCTHDHDHEYDYDYTKNFLDALNKRPGEFVEYNWMAANFYLLTDDKKDTVHDGILQTPINLDTGMPINKTFKDVNFDFKYNTIDPSKQVKFNQKGQQVQVVLDSPNSPMDNFMRTATISLFEPDIPICNLHGL